MTDIDHDRLLSNFEAASKKVRQALGAKQGGAAAESQYGDAYQALVRAGLAPQIRKKYRSSVMA